MLEGLEVGQRYMKHHETIQTIWFFKVTELDNLVGSVTNKPPIRVTERNLQKVTLKKLETMFFKFRL